jgi:hypothetical protein
MPAYLAPAVFLLTALVLTGCSNLSSPELSVATTAPASASAARSQACTGRILAQPGLIPDSDPDLLVAALGQPDQGKLCMGQVFKVTEPVRVYRVWDQAKDYTLYGRWWSFDLPQGPAENYRAANAICPNWSVLNQMSSCLLKAGSKIVVGPGQSADCGDGLVYPQSAVNQVFINNDSRTNLLWVENCDAGTLWPE